MPAAAAEFDVLHLTPRLGRAGGGVWQFVHDLAAAQADAGQRVAVVGLRGPGFDADAGGLAAKAEVVAAEPSPGPLWTLGYSRDLACKVDELAARSRVIHAHGGLRMWTLSVARRASKRHGVPVLLAPHGSFYPWLLRRNRLRKIIASVWDRRNLRAVTAFHATCDAERDFVRAAGNRQPIHVIPPGVEPVVPGDAGRSRRAHGLDGRRIAAFVGYFDRKKGLVRLLRAWRDVAPAGWQLVLAGPDPDAAEGRGEHRAEVLAEAGRLGLNVGVIGDVRGEAKRDLFAAMELLILPSDWENFGVVVGEAYSAGVPGVVTRDAPWPWLEGEEAGWWVEPTREGVAAALREALARSLQELAAMGDRGRRRVEAEYRWSVAAKRLAEVYAALE